jgi:hypothetical protein
MLTRDQWLQRFVGAYQALLECDETEAEEAVQAFDGEEIDLENDCPVETAALMIQEIPAEDDTAADVGAPV